MDTKTMPITVAPVISRPAKSTSYNATKGVSTITQNGASPISAATSISSQSSWASRTSSIGYASSCTSISQEYEYEKGEECEYERTVCGSGGLANAEAEFAKLMTEIPWMRFQITATPDTNWLEGERFKSVFHRLTQKTVKATTTRVISQVRDEMNRVFDQIASSEESIDMTTVIEDIRKGFASGACGAVTNAQTLIAGHLPCGCHHNHGASTCGGAAIPTVPYNGVPGMQQPKVPRESISVEPPAPVLTDSPICILGPLPPAPMEIPRPIPIPASKAPPPNLSAAQWIWTREAANKVPPAGSRGFRKSLTLNEVVDSVTIDITSDNYDTLYVNGKLVGSSTVGVGNEWQYPRRYTVRFEPTKQLVVSVWAMQGTSLRPAAFILAGVAWNGQKREPVSYSFSSDSSWKTQSKGTSEAAFLDALDSEYNDGSWEQAFTQGAFDQTIPWKGRVKPSKEAKWSGRLTNIKGSVDAPEAPPANVV